MLANATEAEDMLRSKSTNLEVVAEHVDQQNLLTADLATPANKPSELRAVRTT
jgi:hypothetical protein